MDHVLLWGGMAISGFFLIRLVLIGLGMLKSPVLRQLQSYSSYSFGYYPYPAIFFWAAVFATCGGVLLMMVTDSRFPAFLPGMLLWFLAGGTVQSPDWFSRNGRWMLPRWYRTLQEHASRDEQRTIAYVWLRLPGRMRRILNSDDRAFETWADLVLLSITTATADQFVYSMHYRQLKTRIAAS